MWMIDLTAGAKGMFARTLHAMDDVAAVALAVIKMRDWSKLRLLLHPYLHWTDVDGRVIRGRTRVMAMLEKMGDAEAPLSIELRD